MRSLLLFRSRRRLSPGGRQPQTPIAALQDGSPTPDGQRRMDVGRADLEQLRHQREGLDRAADARFSSRTTGSDTRTRSELRLASRPLTAPPGAVRHRPRRRRAWHQATESSRCRGVTAASCFERGAHPRSIAARRPAGPGVDGTTRRQTPDAQIGSWSPRSIACGTRRERRRACVLVPRTEAPRPRIPSAASRHQRRDPAAHARERQASRPSSQAPPHRAAVRSRPRS